MARYVGYLLCPHCQKQCVAYYAHEEMKDGTLVRRYSGVHYCHKHGYFTILNRPTATIFSLKLDEVVETSKTIEELLPGNIVGEL